MNSSLFFWLPLIASVAIYFLYRKKYHLNAASWFGGIWLLCLLIQPLFGAHWQIPPTTILIVDCIFIALLITGGVFLCVKIRQLVTIPNKTEKDIRERQRMMLLVSWFIIVLLASFPHVLNHWGVRYLPVLEVSWFYPTPEDVIHHFCVEGMKLSLIITMGVVLMDNIVHRCLYLRSFDTDTTEVEKRICRDLQNLFPVYAIGDPNKVLQPNGAKRIYATDQQWQNVVDQLTKKCKLIVLRVGQSEGTKWEMHHILNNAMLHKTIFITSSQDDYVFLANAVNKLTNISLPEIEIQNETA